MIGLVTALTVCLATAQSPAAAAAEQPAPALSKPAAKPAGGGILVVPFEPPSRDGRTYWLGEAAAVLISDDIRARGLNALTRQARERAYDQLHLPPNAVLSRATVIKVGELVGTPQVVVGEVSVDGDALTVRARAIRIDVGRADTEIVERGSLPDFVAVVQRVARRIAPGGTTSAAARVPALQVFEMYIRGLLAEQPAAQAEFLEAALKLDPSYERTRLALWDVRTSQGNHAAALAAVRGVDAASPYSLRARFLAGVSLMSLKQYDEAFALYKSLPADPPQAAILNNLGVIQIHRNQPADGKPVYFLTKAAQAAPDDPDVLFNLGYAYALDRDPQGAIYWLREALRRNPADGDAHFVLATALDVSGSSVEAGREQELAGQLSARYADGGRRELPKGLERVRQDLESPYAAPVDQAILNTAQRDQQDLAQFHLERGRRLYEKEQDREAMTELHQAVFLSPYEAEAHLLIGRIHLRGGRPRDAVDALKISIWSRDTAAARVALADAYVRLNDLPNARAQVQRALALDPNSSEAKALQSRIDAAGKDK